MTTQFRNFNEAQAINDFGQQPCTQIFTATLAITTDTTVPVPGGGIQGGLPATSKNKVMAIIRATPNSSVWMAFNEVAAIPAGGTFAASTSELITGGEVIARLCNTGDTLHFFCASANVSVSVAFYAVPS